MPYALAVLLDIQFFSLEIMNYMYILPKKGRKTLKHEKTQAPANSVSHKGQKQTYWTTSMKLVLNASVYRQSVTTITCFVGQDTEGRTN